MALIKRFTPGGNVYPDGSSTFAVLVSFFREWAENRDNMDTQIATTAATTASAVAIEAVSENTLQEQTSPTVVFAIVDEDGRRTWLEVAPDGGLTEYSAEKIREALGGGAPAGGGPATITEAATVTGGLVRTAPTTGGWALIHENTTTGNTTTLHEAAEIAGVHTNGTRVFFTATNTDGDTRVLTVDVNDEPRTVAPVTPRVALAAWGDSMTQGTGGGGTSWPSTTATALGWEHHNGGIHAQTSTEIGIRQGGVQPAVTVTGGTIPTTGSVAVTVTDPTTSWRTGSTWSFTGTLSGIPGTLTKAGDNTWTFTRASSGAATAHPAGTPFRSTTGAPHRDWVQTIWVGRNNATASIITRDVASMVAHLAPYATKFLVFGVCTSSGETIGTTGHTNITGINTQLSDTYGARFVDVRRWLIDHGLAEAGITPTQADTTAIAADTLPPSLLSDTLHLNAAGYGALGRHIAAVITQKGWA